MQERWIDLVARIRPGILSSLVADVVGVSRTQFRCAEGVFWIDPFSNFGRTLRAKGTYEPATIACHRALVKTGMTVVDLGSNEGFFSVVSSKLVGDKGRVIAVEPQPNLRKVIEANCRLNRCANVELFEAAVTEQEGSVKLHVSPRSNSGATSVWRPTKYRLPTTTVRTVSLCDLFRERGIDTCGFLKVDVEGSEYEVLRGAEPLLMERRIKAIVLEAHETLLRRRKITVADIHNLLLSKNYQLVRDVPPFVFVAPM